MGSFDGPWSGLLLSREACAPDRQSIGLCASLLGAFKVEGSVPRSPRVGTRKLTGSAQGPLPGVLESDSAPPAGAIQLAAHAFRLQLIFFVVVARIAMATMVPGR